MTSLDISLEISEFCKENKRLIEKVYFFKKIEKKDVETEKSQNMR